MIYRKFGKTGWDVSAIGLGCWNIGNQWGHMSDTDAETIIKTAVDTGINLFDVAESYGIPNGISEIRLGKALKGIREKLYIVSKIGYWGLRTGQSVPKTTTDMIRLCGHACLGRMKTEYVDVMLCHESGIEDPSVYIDGFNKLVDEGHVREYGISTDKLDVLKSFYEMSDGRCRVVEIDYSLINTAPEMDMLPYCIEKGLAVLVRGPMAKGLLSRKYDLDTVFTDEVRSVWNKGAQSRAAYEELIARVDRVVKAVPQDSSLSETGLRYVISHEASPVAIPGATNPQQVIMNARTAKRLLSSGELQAIRNVL